MTMATPTVTFSGLPGKDTAQFVEDIECQAYAIAGPGTSEKWLEKLTHNHFRRSLRGVALDWLTNEVTPEVKANWEETSHSFIDKFPHTLDDTQASRLVADIATFGRRMGESMESYISRAEELHTHTQNKDQKSVLAFRFFDNIMDSSSGSSYNSESTLKEKLIRYLERKNMLDLNDNLTESCTFTMVCEATKYCLRDIGGPGEAHKEGSSPISHEKGEHDGVKQLTKTINDMVTQLSAMTAAQLQQQRSVPSSTQGGRSENKPRYGGRCPLLQLQSSWPYGPGLPSSPG